MSATAPALVFPPLAGVDGNQLLQSLPLPVLALAMTCMLITSAMTMALAWIVEPAVRELFFHKNASMLVVIPLGALGVPVVQAITATTPEADWEAAPGGLSPLDVAMRVAIRRRKGPILAVRRKIVGRRAHPASAGVERPVHPQIRAVAIGGERHVVIQAEPCAPAPVIVRKQRHFRALLVFHLAYDVGLVWHNAV